MGTVKINSEIEDKILKLLAQGILYKDIVKIVKRDFGIDITIMAISHLKQRIKKTITKDMVDNFETERQIDLDIKKASLGRCLSLALEMSETYLNKLKQKQETEGLTEKEMRILNEIIDRIVRLKSVLSAEIVMTKEIQFPTAFLRKKYKVETTKTD